MLRTLCRQYTSLTDEDIGKLAEIEKTISYFATIANADIFIDCFLEKEEKGIVVAHAMPETNSQYSSNITGQFVLPQNEPIVFLTRKMKISIRDEKALSQENKYVLQRTAPIKNDKDQIIGVLIQENDITSSVNTNKKLEEMGRTTERLTDRLLHAQREGSIAGNHEIIANSESGEKNILLREMHHRIKNNLQIISSILSMQERRSHSQETKRILKENVSRINSIALVHEVLLNDDGRLINLNALVSKLILYLKDCAVSEEEEISIVLEGDEIIVDSDKATSILLIINELITNALQHAFKVKKRGEIKVKFVYGHMYCVIMVTDNGSGFAEREKDRGSLGLELMKKIAVDKLNSRLKIETGKDGTVASFDFR